MLRLLTVLLFIFTSCNSTSVNRCDCTNKELIKNMMQDIIDLQHTEKTEMNSSDLFAAFRRLEAIVHERYSLDELSAEYHTDLLTNEAMRNRSLSWINWLSNNICLVNEKMVSYAFATATETSLSELPNEVSMEGLRIKNGLDDDDTTKDSLLRSRYEAMKVNIPLRWPDETED